MENKSANRIGYIDIMKGIGILSVIAGHYGDPNIERVVFTYHLPLFFLISGYFLSMKKPIELYWKEKAVQLLKPYVFTCICVIGASIINNLYYHDKVGKDVLRLIYASLYGAGGDFESPFYVKGIGAIWFLLATFWALLIVRYFAEKRYVGAIAIAVIAYVAYVTSQYIWLPFSIQGGGTAAIFVYVGYLLRKAEFLNKKFNVGLFAFSAGIFAFEIYFFIAPYMYRNYYPNGLFCVIGAIASCYIVLWISRMIEDRLSGLGRILKFLGKNSMIIMCIHLVELNLFVWYETWGRFQSMSGIRRWVAYLVVFIGKVLAYSVCVWIVYKLPCLRKVFGVADKESR